MVLKIKINISENNLKIIDSIMDTFKVRNGYINVNVDITVMVLTVTVLIKD